MTRQSAPLLALLLLLSACGTDQAASGAATDAAATDGGPCALDGAPCDDGDPCTTGDRCAAGVCAGGANLCACDQDSDCASREDGDLCNGTLVCDKATLPYRCVVDPKTVVTCPGGADTACSKAACDPKTGDCGAAPLADGTPCLDGDPCTQGDVCQGGTCKGEPSPLCECTADADCAEQEDGDLCNGTLYCDTKAHRCRRNPATVVQCANGGDTPCTKNACDPAKGTCAKTHAELVETACDDLGCRPVVSAKPAADPVPCDDGDSCSLNTTCKAGKCQGGVDLCACKTDGDCAQQEDGDLCNGSLYCDVKAGKCKVNPATVIVCPATGDSACIKNVCVPSTGQCALSPVANGTVCDDANPCTAGDVCVQGQCNPGAKSICPCQSNSDCDKHDDGDLCNGVMFCNQSTKQCQPDPSGVVTCATTDDTACGKHVCAPKTGACVVKPRVDVTEVCVGAGASKTCKWVLLPPGSKPDGGPYGCEDGDSCTKGDTCEGATCKPGTVACTCDKDADCSDEDADVCTGVPYCDKSNPKKPVCKTNPKTVITCDKGADTACLKAACDPKTGACAMAPQPTGLLCDDGKPCTKGDFCSAGKCTPGTFVCACETDADCTDTDGDKCTGVPYCDKSTPGKNVCKPNPGSAVFCATGDDTACLKNTCDKITGKCGLKPVKDGAACDDDNPCTTQGSCAKGTCSGLTNVCECQSDADCEAKDDGDKCNGTPYCDKSGAKPACKANPASVVVCSPKDDTACLKNSCDPKTGQCGLKAKKDGTSCDDGSACTDKDGCKAGQCAGAAKDCDDSNPCTTDTCDPKSGCVHTPVTCDDGAVCTADSCDPKTGKCVFDAAGPQGKVCNADDDGCTVNDTCDKGVCKPGTKVACSGATAECQVAKCASTSATAFSCVKTVAPDGAACADGKSCQIGAVCKGGKCQAGTADRLFAKAVPAAKQGALALRALAATSAGPVVGGRLSGGEAGAGKVGWWVGRLGEDGAVLWGQTLKGGAHAGAGVVAVGLESGGVAATGSAQGKGGDLDLAVVVYGAGGKSVTLDQTVGQAGVDERALRGLQHNAGGWLLLGDAAKPGALKQASPTQAGGGTARAWRLSAGGLLGWTWDAGVPGQLRGASVAGDGGAWLVGRDDAKATAAGLVARVDAVGKKVGQWTLAHADAQGLVGAVALSDGALVAGWRQVSGSARLWIARLDKAGKPAWQRISSAKVTAHALARHGAGWVVAGQVPGVIGADAALLGLDAAGRIVWQRGHDAGGDEGAAAVLASAAGQLSAVGWRGKAPTSGLVWVTSAWGQDSCGAAGACAGKAPSACADANACTDDLCDPLSGCVASANTASCEDGDQCTSADQCVNKSCKAGLNADCDDANPCTKDTCDPKSGCQHPPVADLTPCATGKACLAGVCSKRWANVVTAGYQQSCAVGTDGKARCWGDTFRGKLGNGGINKGSGKLHDVVKISGVVDISTGYGHTCAVTSDHSAWCFGETATGQLGIGTISYNTNHTPLLVVGAPDTRTIRAWARKTCAIDGKGALRCWGQNQWHAIAKVGGQSAMSKPVLMKGFGVVKAVAPGLRHICAVKQDGSVVCSGGNYYGQLGIGKGKVSWPEAPVQVPDLSGATAIVAGEYHTCAIVAGGKVKCWGRGEHGELGNGTKAVAWTPSEVFNLSDAVALGVGLEHSCAVKKDGTVWCWGDNQYGQLGLGHKFGTVAPAQVKSLSAVIQVDCGNRHTCFLKKTGEVLCTGYNSYGQLGLGSYGWDPKLVPTLIPESKP